jgi:hypothetical protein
MNKAPAYARSTPNHCTGITAARSIAFAGGLNWERTMKTIIIAGFAMLAAASSLPASAGSPGGTLSPMEARHVNIGEREAVVYYVARATDFEVVITFAANSPDNGVSMRSVVSLRPGQQTSLSIGGDAKTPASTLELSRDGDSLRIGSAPGEVAAR